jgi:FXSXX-COOH protein
MDRSMGDLSAGDSGLGQKMPIIDFSGISLDQLAKLDDSVLINSLNRILGDVENPDDVVFAGFNASI